MSQSHSNKTNQQARSSREENVELQSKRILGAALQTFAETGYIGTKISDIASKAGVSHGLVHHYHDSKLQLYTTILEAGLDFLQVSRQRALADEGTLDQSLRRWVYTMIHCFDREGTSLFGRLVMQVLGAPAIHPSTCVETLNTFTYQEIQELGKLISKTGKSNEEVFTLSWLTFNTLLGNKLIGNLNKEGSMVLYHTCCNLLQIAAQPVPSPIQYPSFPWEIQTKNADPNCL